MLIVDVDHQITDAMQKDGFSVQVDKCSQLLESTLALYSEAGQTAGQVKSNLNGTSLQFWFSKLLETNIILAGETCPCLNTGSAEEGRQCGSKQVGLLRHPGERILQLAHGLGFSVLVNSSGLAAVGWLL